MQPNERFSAIILCGALGADAPLDFVRAALRDPAPLARVAGCIALAGLAQWADPDWILPLLRDRDSDAQAYAAEALKAFGDRIPLRETVDALVARGVEFEDRIAEALGIFKERFPRDVLEELARSHPNVAAVIIGNLGEAAPLDLLSDLLAIPWSEEQRTGRAEALLAAQTLARPELAPALLAIMRNAAEPLRYDAAWALGAIGDLAYLPEVAALLDGVDDADLYELGHALAGFGAQMPVAALIAFIQDHPDSDMQDLVSALGEAGARTPADFLMAFARDEEQDEDARGEAAAALATFAASGAASADQYAAIFAFLTECLDDEEAAQVRYSAAFGLGLTKDQAALDRLMPLVADPTADGFVAGAAAHGLVLLGQAGFHAPIAMWERVLAESADLRRKFAILALGQRADAPPEIFLRYLSDRHVREMAAQHLLKHPPANARELARAALAELAAADDPLAAAARNALG